MSARKNGIVIGIVTSLDDPERLGRVKVRYPHLDDTESDWARVASPMAGKERGLFMRPDVDDEVLVVQEQTDFRRSYIVGCLWSKVDTPPPDDGNAVQNNWRFFRSRSGHLMKFDDTSGSELIEFEDKDGAFRIVIDSANKKVRLEADDGDIEVTASAGVTIKAESVKVEASTVEVKGDTVSVEAAQTLDLKAGTSMTIDGGQSMTLKASMININ